MTCRQAMLLVGIGMIAGLAGCSPPAVTTFTLPTLPTQPTSLLFVITPPTSLAINASTALSAAITSNSTNALIAWSASCGSANACGSFSFTQTESGGNSTYTAPSAIPSGATVTVKATIVGNTTQTVSASITITPPLPIAVSFEGVPAASLQVNATAPFSAKVTNDVSPNPQVNWTVTCANAPCGSFSPTTTNNEAQTNYTAPAAIPSGNTVTVTATSVTDKTKSISANVTITKAAATLADGTYVFHLSGPVGPGANFVSGAIVAQGGTITGGEQDFSNYALDQNAQEQLTLFDPITGGSYTTTPDGNLQFTLKTNDINVGNETIDGVIVSASSVLLTEINGSIANGTLDLQTSKAAPSGGYAFSTFGVDLFGQPAGIGGILNVDTAGKISGTGSVLDINDNFVFTGAQSVGASTVSGPDSFGRVVFQIEPSTPSAFQSFFLAGYIVDGTRIRLIETGGDNFQGVMGGTALSQGASIGTFSSSSIAGSSYVFGVGGEGANGPLQVAGVLTANANGTLTGTLNWNDLTGKTTQSPIAFTGSYTVDPTGRATLSNLSDGSTFTYQLEFYLMGTGQGLLLSGSGAEMIAGRGFQQQTGAFTAGSFSGSYGLNAIEIASSLSPLGATAPLGPITAVAGSGVDTLTGFVDYGTGATDFPVTGSVTAASTGIFTGTLTGLNVASYTSPDNFTFYLVNSAQALMIETDNAQLTLGYLALQQ